MVEAEEMSAEERYSFWRAERVREVEGVVEEVSGVIVGAEGELGEGSEGRTGAGGGEGMTDGPAVRLKLNLGLTVTLLLLVLIHSSKFRSSWGREKGQRSSSSAIGAERSRARATHPLTSAQLVAWYPLSVLREL